MLSGACPDSCVIERTWIATDDCTEFLDLSPEDHGQDVEQPEYNQEHPISPSIRWMITLLVRQTADYSLMVDQNLPLAAGQTTVSFTIHG